MSRLMGNIDRIAAGACLAAFLISAALSIPGFRRLDAIAARGPAPRESGSRYEPRPAAVPTIEAMAWPDAPPQSRGKDWVYDVFSPPVIYYNRETGEFTVTPPEDRAPAAAPVDRPFDLELAEVRQEPYRIQLVGYAGADGAYMATFDLLESGQTVVARPGATVEKGEFSLVSFDVRKTTTPSMDSMPVVESVAVAVVLDRRTGREETLTNRERKMMPRLQGVFRLRGSPGEVRSLREGASIDLGGWRYLVTQLSLLPPKAVVSRRAPETLGASETRTLLVGGRPAAP